jgi:hypothetical protein
LLATRPRYDSPQRGQPRGRRVRGFSRTL